MDSQLDRLVNKLIIKYEKTPHDQRYIVSISGIPGSGKTTLSKLIATRLNDLHSNRDSEVAIAIPMDGFHLTRAHLDDFPDPKAAHARRGAPFTFNVDALHLFLQDLRQPLANTELFAPSFSHELGDPVQDDIVIKTSTRIIIFEGNYLAFNQEKWRDVADLFDERWFLEIDFSVAESRLVTRHLSCGITKFKQEAEKRVRENDLVNGKDIVENQYRIDETIFAG